MKKTCLIRRRPSYRSNRQLFEIIIVLRQFSYLYELQVINQLSGNYLFSWVDRGYLKLKRPGVGSGPFHSDCKSSRTRDFHSNFACCLLFPIDLKFFNKINVISTFFSFSKKKPAFDLTSLVFSNYFCDFLRIFSFPSNSIIWRSVVKFPYCSLPFFQNNDIFMS